MSISPTPDERAAPDSLVALLPVHWNDDQLEVLEQTHPDVWAEPLSACSPEGQAVRALRVGDTDQPVQLHIDEPLPDLAQLTDTAKQPFTPAEATRLKQHTAVWRLTMTDISEPPLDRAHAFARLITTAVDAGAPGVFFPFCLQLHSPGLVHQLAVDFSKPPSLVNLYVNAWNDDDWMVTRGLTVFGYPELETRIDAGLNDAYFRLMDIAAGMLVQRGPYHSSARLEVGPRLFRIEPGRSGPEDTMVPICGAFGRRTVVPCD